MSLRSTRDSLKTTATGPDGLPAWLLRLGAPMLTYPISLLFNRSLRDSYVPSQWKGAYISPIAKIAQPQQPADYRPISITSVLSCLFEKMMVKQFVYPAILSPVVHEELMDQFAFRPTGSTTSALVALLSKVTSMLQTNSYVRIIALDFSKAFDTVRHSELGKKIASVPINDQVHNWIMNYIDKRHHFTKIDGQISKSETINASVVQGSAIGHIF